MMENELINEWRKHVYKELETIKDILAGGIQEAVTEKSDYEEIKKEITAIKRKVTLLEKKVKELN